MSEKLPALTGNELIKVLEKVGFVVSRIRGSHHVLKHPEGKTTVVPVHSGEIIGPGLLRKIIRDCGLERDQFMDLLS